jgi:hypothetical protein
MNDNSAALTLVNGDARTIGEESVVTTKFFYAIFSGLTVELDSAVGHLRVYFGF